MDTKIGIILIFLVAVVFVSGCTQGDQKPTSTSTATSTQTTTATPTTPESSKVAETQQITSSPTNDVVVSSKSAEDVLRGYISLSSVSSSDQSISSGEAQISLTEEPLKTLLLDDLDFKKQSKQNFDSFISDYEILCKGVLSKDKCNEGIGIWKDSNEAVHTIKYNIISIKEIQNDGSTAALEVQREITTISNKTKETVVYNLKNVGGEWKIFDKDRKSASLIDENKRINKEALQGIKDLFQSELNKLAKIKTDKCGYLFVLTLTQTELQIEQNICYRGQYINNAVLKKDVSLCNEISDDAYYGTCYGAVAAEMKSVSICDSIEDRKYQAKAFYDPLSTKDVCYLNYVTVLLTKNTLPKTDLTTACNFIVNGQLKQQCLLAVGQ